ncbi:MAG: MFS transporter [Candidatus Puniceispirillaceae bacterium]
MFRSLLTSWPLFFGLLLIMIGNGLMVLVLGIRASEAGFGSVISGIMMGGYFAGFFGGSAIVPRFLRDVGHIRTFGALAAIASAAVILHLIAVDPVLWTFLRIIAGFSYAGMYIVVESWLNEKSTNETRGQMLAIYMIITMAGMSGGQVLGGIYDITTVTPFLLASVLVSIAVVPILLTAARAPDFTSPDPVSIRRLYQISPLALIGMLLQGLTASMAFGIGAIYATDIGMTESQASLFMAAFTLGNMLLQYPVGRLSDLFDRRVMILVIALGAGIAASFAASLSAQQFWILVIVTALYGGLSLTIYSLCIAHANDYLTPSQMVSTASTLITINGIGAIFGSPLIGFVMQITAPSAFFWVIALVHFGLAGFVLLRMLSRPSVPADAQAPFVAVPEIGTAVAVQLNPETPYQPTEAFEVEDPLSDNPYLDITSLNDPAKE